MTEAGSAPESGQAHQKQREIEELGGEALAIPTDVAGVEAFEAAADQVASRFGPVEVWVNKAMVSVFSPVREMRPEEYRRVTEVTYLGTVHGTLAALRQMLPLDRGVIIQVGSALAYRAIPLQSAYCAANHAIQGFTESLRSELMRDRSRVRVAMLQLPAVNTPHFDWVKSRLPRRAKPVPPIYQPEVIARGVIWAADHDRKEMYLGWSAAKAIAANRLIPRLLDRYLAREGFASPADRRARGSGPPEQLVATVPGDVGAHGRFDDTARGWSSQIALSEHRGLVLAGVGAITLAALARRRRR